MFTTLYTLSVTSCKKMMTVNTLFRGHTQIMAQSEIIFVIFTMPSSDFLQKDDDMMASQEFTR